MRLTASCASVFLTMTHIQAKCLLSGVFPNQAEFAPLATDTHEGVVSPLTHEDTFKPRAISEYEQIGLVWRTGVQIGCFVAVFDLFNAAQVEGSYLLTPFEIRCEIGQFGNRHSKKTCYLRQAEGFAFLLTEQVVSFHHKRIAGQIAIIVHHEELTLLSKGGFKDVFLTQCVHFLAALFHGYLLVWGSAARAWGLLDVQVNRIAGRITRPAFHLHNVSI